MSGSISRIGSTGPINRDTPSSGHEAIANREKQQASRVPNDPSQRRGVGNDVRAKVQDVAKMYEKQFLGEMLKSMRSTVTHTDQPSMAQNIYQDQLDSQYVDQWGDTGGIGLSKLIYEQIMEKYFGESPTDAMRSQGAPSLSNRENRVSRIGAHGPSGGTLVAANGNAQVPLKVEVKPSTNAGPAKVQAPWDASVVQTSQVDGKTAVTLEHGEGVRSTLIFDGVPASEVKVGEKLAKGQSLGTLNPDAKSFMWNLNHSKGPVKAPASVEVTAGKSEPAAIVEDSSAEVSAQAEAAGAVAPASENKSPASLVQPAGLGPEAAP